jgi:hypothetical protein
MTADTASHVNIFGPALWTVYTDSVRLGGCGWGVLSCVGDHSLCIWPDSEPTKLLDLPKQKPKRGGSEHQTDKQLPQNSWSFLFLSLRFFGVEKSAAAPGEHELSGQPGQEQVGPGQLLRGFCEGEQAPIPTTNH